MPPQARRPHSQASTFQGGVPVFASTPTPKPSPPAPKKSLQTSPSLSHFLPSILNPSSAKSEKNQPFSTEFAGSAVLTRFDSLLAKQCYKLDATARHELVVNLGFLAEYVWNNPPPSSLYIINSKEMDADGGWRTAVVQAGEARRGQEAAPRGLDVLIYGNRVEDPDDGLQGLRERVEKSIGDLLAKADWVELTARLFKRKIPGVEWRNRWWGEWASAVWTLLQVAAVIGALYAVSGFFKGE